jgi:hypothetical protein
MGEYMESGSRESYWFSGPRKDGNDRKGTSRSVPIEIDGDVRVEHWTGIRQQPERVDERTVEARQAAAVSTHKGRCR